MTAFAHIIKILGHATLSESMQHHTLWSMNARAELFNRASSSWPFGSLGNWFLQACNSILLRSLQTFLIQQAYKLSSSSKLANLPHPASLQTFIIQQACKPSSFSKLANLPHPASLQTFLIQQACKPSSFSNLANLPHPASLQTFIIQQVCKPSSSSNLANLIIQQACKPCSSSKLAKFSFLRVVNITFKCKSSLSSVILQL